MLASSVSTKAWQNEAANKGADKNLERMTLQVTGLLRLALLSNPSC